MEGVQDRATLLLPPLIDALDLGQAVRQSLFACHCLDMVEPADHVERLFGASGRILLRLERLVKLTPQVCKTSKVFEAAEHAPGGVAIGHDGTRIALEEAFRMFMPAPGLILEQHDRPSASLAAAVDPHVRLALGLAAILLEHLDRGLVAMDDGFGQ